VKQVARELGVRYVLEGSVRKAGGRVRVTGQLIEADTGAHLWAQRFDRDSADIFALQDEISESVVGAIEPEMLLGEGRRAARKSPANLDAYDCCMRGIWCFNQFTRDDIRQAETWLRRSIELDPKLARAHMCLARLLHARSWYGWSDDIARDLAEAQTAAERAVALDDRDPYAHYALFLVRRASGRHQQALAEAQRAIDLSPNFALGHFALGWARIYIGRFAEALDPLLRCLRLNPRDPQAYLFISLMALAQYHLGNYEEAIHYAERALSGRRIYPVLSTLLASLGQLGRTEEAKAVLAEMERIEPADAKRHWEFTTPYADPAHRAHLIEGLRKAGMAI
jgi:pentatricopeptide repeat protein